MKLEGRPNTVFIDANHEYEFVRQDIETLYHLTQPPWHVAFHDYSLRSLDGLIGVDRAIHEIWGPDAPLIRIGWPIGLDPQPVSELGHNWEPNGSEGAFFEFDSLRIPWRSRRRRAMRPCRSNVRPKTFNSPLW